MCELLAVVLPAPAPFGDVLPRVLDLEHYGVAGFGWGVAWQESDGTVRSHRSAASCAGDADGRAETAGAVSARFLVHLRRPSRLSTVQLADSQPFRRDDAPSFAFCHNGYLERHDELRDRYTGLLRGRADTEVGFHRLAELLGGGPVPEDPALGPADALPRLHEELGGRANFGYLGPEGLVVYSGNRQNALWRLRVGGADVVASGLHSADRSLPDLVFPDADEAELLPTGSLRLGGERADDRSTERRVEA